MQLIWHGPVFGQSGYEVLTRGLLMALDKLGVTVRLDPAQNWNAERIRLDWDVAERLNRMTNNSIAPNAPLIMHQHSQPISIQVTPQTKKYCYSLFETDRIPKPWKAEFAELDGIFTFSEFNRKYWIADGIPEEKIHVLPYGINREFMAEGPRASIVNGRGFTFLTNGDFTERKNFEALIQAYIEEFKPREDVCLIIKSHYKGFTRAHRRDLLEKLRALVPQNAPKILFYGDKISTADLANLYRGSDCFVLPSRGEGLGLPVLEAAACGLPVIVTNWSSLAELDVEGIKISCSVDVIDDIEYIKKCPHALNHKWASIDIPELRKAMRKMFEDRTMVSEMGKSNAEKMQEKTWHEAAVKIIDVLFKGGQV